MWSICVIFRAKGSVCQEMGQFCTPAYYKLCNSEACTAYFHFINLIINVLILFFCKQSVLSLQKKMSESCDILTLKVMLVSEITYFSFSVGLG
jgi:hypothetical protein